MSSPISSIPARELSSSATDAVILMADASGFSRLCAQIVAEDQRGADAISGIVNRHIGRLAGIVTRYGGSVVTFAGDSIWAIWHKTSVPLAERLQAATAAGLEIAKTAGDVGAERAMRFGCVIDCGQMDLWPVDDDPRAAPIICGNLPEQIVALAGHMQAGHLTISTSAAQVLGDTIKGDTSEGVVTVKKLDVSYHPYVTSKSKPVDLGIDPQLPKATSGGWIDEICRASIVFMRFPQIATDQSGAKEILGSVIAAAREITDTFGGQVVQAKVDDKGLVFLAAWGLARSRAEDDAVRAAKAALAYQEAAQARDVATAIGIGTGRVFAGIVGDESFRTYTVLGAAVNRAAWLMQQAGEGIIADPATHEAAEAGIRFAEWGQLVFKGEETPTPVYTPQMAQTSRQTPIGRLIGRAEELSRFDAALLSTDRPVVWISGEAGIGKSHFLHVAQSRLQAKGRTTMLGSGEGLTRNQPFVAWRAILRQLLDTTEPEARARLVETVRALSLPEETADLIAPFFGFDSDTTVAPPRALDTGDAARMQEGLLAIVASRIGTADIALLFEDAHWLDTASWRLIAAVKARCPQVQVVLSNRPLDLWTLPAEARTLYTSSAACHIPLGRLSLAASRELICDVIGASTLPEELARRIQDRAEGHAYYTKELAAALLRRDSIRVRSGHCYIPNGVENLHASAFPDNIEGAIASRFAQLTPEAQLTLKVASVSGRVFDPVELAPVHPEAPDHATLAAQLDAAQRLDLIEDSPAQNTKRFHHALTRDTIYGLMTDRQRQHLHREIAARLEKTGAARDPDRHAVIGYHWSSAGDAGKAIGYLSSASDHAGLSQSYYEQAELLRQAMRLDATLPQPAGPQIRGQWETRIARAFFQLGDVSASVKHGERAVSALVAPMPGKAAVIPRLFQEIWRVKTGRPGPAPTSEEERDTLLSAAQTCIEISFHTYEMGKLPLSMFVTFLAVNLARRAGKPSVPLAIGNANIAIASLSLPFLFDGRKFRQEAIEIAEAVGDPVGLYWIGVTASTHAFATGQLDIAIALADRAIQMGRDHLQARDFEAASSHKANFMRAGGYFAEGFALDSQTLVSGRDRGAIQGRIWGLNGCCRSALAMGETEALLAHTNELEALLSDPGNAADLSVNNSIALLVSRAQLALVEGKPEVAGPHLDAAASILVAVSGPQYYLEEVPGNLGDALLRCWQLNPGYPVLSIARKVLKCARLISRTYPIAAYRPHLARGDLALYQGKPERARAHWQKAREAAAASGFPFSEAHAEMRLALFSDAARERVDTLFAQIGAPVPAHWCTLLADKRLARALP